ncbi:MAG: hypothetical protein LUF85_09950 [Bacteroides sp.]|nr:hypothetical protein [Bacteroides sp.]
MKENNNLLSETAAALYLGITKELLYAYVNNAPKKNKGEDRKLKTIVIDGENYFDKEELDRFDFYLKEPWSDSASSRPPLPDYIKAYLQIESGGKCPISEKGAPLENAHIIPYHESLNHHHHNIIRISQEIHTKVDKGIIPRKVLKLAKEKLIEKLKMSNSPQKEYAAFRVPGQHPLHIPRLKEASELAKIMSENQLVVIEGMGGIGKTQLLIYTITHVEYYNPIIWMDMESIESFSDFLILFNQSIAPYVSPADSNIAFEALRDKQLTFVFDSLEKLLVEERDEIEDFIIELLSKTQQIQLLITSQMDLSLLDYTKKIFKLNGLGTEESQDLITELLNGEMEVSAGDRNWIIDFCNGHPLSIKLTVTLIKFYKSSQRVIQLLTNNEPLKHPTRNRHNKQTSLSVCLSTIYDILNEEQKDILHFLKFFPIGVNPQWIEEKFQSDSFHKNMAELQHFFFIEQVKDFLYLERHVIPNPIRPFLREKIKEKNSLAEIESEKEAMVMVMAEAAFINSHYIQSGTSNDLAYGTDRIINEMPNLLFILHTAQQRARPDHSQNPELKEQYLEIIAIIANSLGKCCFTRGLYKEGVLFAKAGIDAYRKLQNYSAAALQYMYLALLQSRMFHPDALEETINELENLIELDDHYMIEVYTYWTEGLLHFDRKRYLDSRSCYQEAVEILEEQMEMDKQSSLDEEESIIDRGNLILLKMEIAKTYEFQKQYSKAVPIYKNLMDHLPENFPPDNKGSMYHHYAYCLCKTNKIQEGVAYYYEAIDYFSKTGQFEYTGNSIADLAEFLENSTEIINHPVMNEELFYAALKSITNQLIYLPDFNKGDYVNNKAVPYELLGKMISIVKAVSFSPHSLILNEWVEDLFENFPLENSKPEIFTAIVNLAHCIGGVHEWKYDQETVAIMTKSILQDCLIINAGPDYKSKTRIFYWLAQWMKFTGLQPNATAKTLWNQGMGYFRQYM